MQAQSRWFSPKCGLQSGHVLMGSSPCCDILVPCLACRRSTNKSWPPWRPRNCAHSTTNRLRALNKMRNAHLQESDLCARWICHCALHTGVVGRRVRCAAATGGGCFEDRTAAMCCAASRRDAGGLFGHGHRKDPSLVPVGLSGRWVRSTQGRGIRASAKIA